MTQMKGEKSQEDIESDIVKSIKWEKINKLNNFKLKLKKSKNIKRIIKLFHLTSSTQYEKNSVCYFTFSLLSFL